MDKYIKANKKAWGILAEDHYRTFNEVLDKYGSTLNSTQIKELDDIKGKSVIHLQCNTGADTISLAKLGAKEVTGVDLAPENIEYARKLSNDLDIKNISFIESDVLEIMDKHTKKYDIVFTTEGVLIWLPDLDRWASNIRHLLNDGGYLYLMDGHPFFMVWCYLKNSCHPQY